VSDHVERVRAICLALPGVVEEQAWVGTRWVVRKKNFAHVVDIVDGHPPAYAEAAGTADATVLTFRAPPDELDALRHAGPPFFKPVWFTDIVGLVLDDATDWDEVAELVTDSHHLFARPTT
jgi:predicted DNA-binding protein (MmcQ/YjbR family)